MTAQKGKDLLIRIAEGGGFTAVAGLRARQIAFNAETVDITSAESAGRWRELLAGAGVRRASISGSGVFRDEASDARLRQVFFDGTIETYLCVLIAQQEYAGSAVGRKPVLNLSSRANGISRLPYEKIANLSRFLSYSARPV